jgi:hypothetical protein
MRHFRLTKGYKRELEEISLGVVVAMLLVMIANAATVAASSRNAAYAAGGGAVAASLFVYYGKVITYEQCTTPISNGPLCTVANRTAPFQVVLTDNKTRPLATYPSGTAQGVVPVPVPGGYVIGLGLPIGIAHQLGLFWMFPPGGK